MFGKVIRWALSCLVAFVTSVAAAEEYVYNIAPYVKGGDHKLPKDALQVGQLGGWSEEKKRRYVVMIYRDKAGKDFQCNGSVVAPNLIITAAHCLMKEVDDEGWISTPKAVVTQKGTNFEVAGINIARDYGDFPPKDYRSISDDVAFIRTKDDPTPETGCLSIMRHIKLKSRVDKKIELTGFRPSLGKVVTESCTIDLYWSPITYDRIGMACDVEPGMSGSPVIAYKGGRWRLAGVVSGGRVRGERKGREIRWPNFASLLDDDGHDATYTWVKKMVKGCKTEGSGGSSSGGGASHMM